MSAVGVVSFTTRSLFRQQAGAFTTSTRAYHVLRDACGAGSRGWWLDRWGESSEILTTTGRFGRLPCSIWHRSLAKGRGHFRRAAAPLSLCTSRPLGGALVSELSQRLSALEKAGWKLVNHDDTGAVFERYFRGSRISEQGSNLEEALTRAEWQQDRLASFEDSQVEVRSGLAVDQISETRTTPGE